MLNEDLSPPLIADGSVRTRLMLTHPGGEEPVEALNLTGPERVREVHGEFLAAGASLHRTNTHAANRVALGAHQLEERCEAVNNSASALVRDVIGAQGHMMGAIGEIAPQGAGGDASVAERERAYSEQAVYLADTGVTFLLLEHFTRVEEALRVLRIARNTSDAPLLAQLRFDHYGKSGDGLSCAEAAGRLAEAGADALGISCGPAPEALPPLLEALLAPGLPVSVMLGVHFPGLPPPYPDAPALTPAAFAETLHGCARAGATIVGGCCGVGPEHIQALAARMQRGP